MPIVVTDSILDSIKQVVGLEQDDKSFDLDILMHINTVFFSLNQIGVGPVSGYSIGGSEEIWSDYTGGFKNLNAVKSYVYIRVRLLFDPPNNSFLGTSLEKQATELEWRLMVEADPSTTDVRSEVGLQPISPNDQP